MHILAYNYRRLAHSDRRKFRTKFFGEIGFYDTGSFFALLRDSREKNARDHVDEIDNRGVNEEVFLLKLPTKVAVL